MGSGAVVYIFFALNDKADKKFADDLGKQIQAFVTPVFRDISELVRYNRSWWRRRRGHPGIPIFILSESVVSNPENRRALAEWVQFTRRRDYHHYYICRGVEPTVLQAKYADLTPVFEDVMVLKEDKHPALLADLTDYANRIWPEVGGWAYRRAALLGLVRLLVATLLTVASHILEVLYYLSCIAATVLVVILLSKSSSSWNFTLALGSMYAVGYGLGKIVPPELWPLLGPRWFVPSAIIARLASEEYEASLRKAGVGTLFLLVSWGLAVAMFGKFLLFTTIFLLGNILRGARLRSYGQKLLHIVEATESLSPQLDRHMLTSPMAVCSEKDLKNCFQQWTGARWANVVGSAVPLCLFLAATIAAMKSSAVENWIYSIGVFALGVMTRPIFAWAQKTTAVESAVERGLSTWLLEKEKQGSRRYFVRTSLGDSELSQQIFSCLNESELKQARRWAATIAAPVGWFTRRWWLTRRDYVFVSYVWADDSEIRMSGALARELEDLKVPFFLDKRDVESQFASWREILAPGLERCTHMFLVVSPNIRQGTVVQRELATAVYRWYYEMLPAIICVIEPDVARTLREDPTIPLHLRFVLTWCPQLTFAEAKNPLLVASILKHTQRQGLLRDWVTVLSRRYGMLRILDNFASVNRALAMNARDIT